MRCVLSQITKDKVLDVLAQKQEIIFFYGMTRTKKTYLLAQMTDDRKIWSILAQSTNYYKQLILHMLNTIIAAIQVCNLLLIIVQSRNGCYTHVYCTVYATHS
jgi:hypothetical protein